MSPPLAGVVATSTENIPVSSKYRFKYGETDFQSWLFCPSTNSAFRFLAAHTGTLPSASPNHSLRRIFMSKCYITSGMLGQDHYIHRLRAACLQQPEYNRHQLAALDRELAIVRTSATPEEHLEVSGHMLGLARAAVLDRAANALDTARRYDDPWSAAAAGIDYVYANRGANHAELYTNLHEGIVRSAPLRERSTAVHTSFNRLFTNLLHLHTSNFELGSVFADIDHCFQTLRNNDPAFIPRKWIHQRRFRLRLPWHSELVHEWLEPYWDRFDANPPPVPADPGSLVQPGGWGQESWPDATPLEAPADTTIADSYLRRQLEWPDAFLSAHWHSTKDAVRSAASPIAQAAVAADRDALFQIESARNHLEFSAFLAPLRAQANHGWEQTDQSREGFEKALATSRALTGLSYQQILESPRTQHFLEHNIRPRLEHGCEGFGAMQGEAGFDLLRHCYPLQAVRGSVDFYA
jgi:hypothetical protein